VTSAPADPSWPRTPTSLAKFLKVTADANAMWADEANHAEMLPVIAKDAGMDEEATAETMATFVFPTVEEQLSPSGLAAARRPS
jgi:taurine transport system substrate-binding protein